jgi:hypothetical protein
MPSSDSNVVLNRVLVLLERSFPQYLRWARPYIPTGREIIMPTIHQIVAGADTLAERVSRQIFESGGLPDHGDFPIEFTDAHDLSIDFLVNEAVDCLKADVSDLQQCSDLLRLAPPAQSLASEAVGLVKGHLDLLKNLATGGTASTKLGATPAYANDAPVSKEASGTPHRQEERKRLAGEANAPS